MRRLLALVVVAVVLVAGATYGIGVRAQQDTPTVTPEATSVADFSAWPTVTVPLCNDPVTGPIEIHAGTICRIVD